MLKNLYLSKPTLHNIYLSKPMLKGTWVSYMKLSIMFIFFRYVPMRPCIVKPSFSFQRLGVGETPKWPARLKEAPERSRLFSGGSEGGFRMDTRVWIDILKYYKTVLPDLDTSKIRNVMDMNTKYGGFAAALIDSPVWVMNIVSAYAANSLGAIYDRGLIGTVHDWFVYLICS